MLFALNSILPDHNMATSAFFPLVCPYTLLYSFILLIFFSFGQSRGACGILVPGLEMEPLAPAVEALSPNH